MKNLQLRIVHAAGERTGSPRLCESCGYGLLMRGEGMEFTWCAYMREYVSVRVESCSRYVSGQEETAVENTALEMINQYVLD